MNACLTIVLPKIFEEELVDHLLEHPEWVPGFTTGAVSGHGHAIAYHAAAEQVLGRAERVQVQIVLEQAHVAPLIAHLKESLHSAEIAYWLTPVIEFGRFA